MSYFSQTGGSITDTRRNLSTARGVERDGVVFNQPNNIVVRIENENPVLSKAVPGEEQAKEELTKEEEDRFYKKVFKTSLI